MAGYFDQGRYGVRFGWGRTEATALTTADACLVIVDVLSFSTAVSVAVDRGTAVYPYRWQDRTAGEFAAAHDAELAVGRRMVDPQHPWSLSPATLRAAPSARRLVLPSPNGATIAAGAIGGTIVAGCLRNAAAIADWLTTGDFGTPQRPVVVVAAGEHWPDGSLRPCLEDLLGAGAILAGLGVAAERFAPEAAATRATYSAVPGVADAVRGCGSGIELAEQGFAADVEVAVELNASDAVPIMRDAAFTGTAPSD